MKVYNRLSAQAKRDLLRLRDVSDEYTPVERSAMRDIERAFMRGEREYHAKRKGHSKTRVSRK